MNSDLSRGMKVITLGTAGGPLLRKDCNPNHKGGIATVIVVDNYAYMVDCGHSVGPSYVQAGLTFPYLRAIFITHHHSDHTIDLNSVMVLGGLALRGRPFREVPVYGPGDRGMVPEVQNPDMPEPDVIFPESPTPGTAEMVELLLRAHATDLNDRRRDSKAPDISKIFKGYDIHLPPDCGFHPNEQHAPRISPFDVYEDEHVKVTATLVNHPPIAPAFGFRFVSKYGSVTISGDTAPSENLVELAHNTDILIHEAIDLDAVARSYPNASPKDLEASMGHHRRAHSTPEQAGEIASRAGAKTLALHHLVPSTSPVEAWQRAATTFSGELLIPTDGEVLTVTP